MCQEFLKRQEELFRTSKAVPLSSKDASVPPAADPRMRAREGLVRVLFNHDEFLTVR